MGIYKVKSGLIFDDTFQTIDQRWEMYPSQSVSLSESGLVLSHSDFETLVLFELPQEDELMFQIHADYVPTEVGDEGGIIIWKDGYYKLEFLENADITSKEYNTWRAYKKGNRWEFYADRGNGFELIDAAVLDAVKAGVVLKNPPKDNYKPLILKRAILSRGKKVLLTNLTPGQTVYLNNKDGYMVKVYVVKEQENNLSIDLPEIPFNGFIRVLNDKEELVAETPVLDLYGGDQFSIGADIDVLYDGVPLSSVNPNYLGELYNEDIIIKLDIVNNTPISVNDVVVSISQYLNEFGYEWALLAEDINGSPGEFFPEIRLGNIEPSGKKSFWLKISRQDTNIRLNLAKFVLDIKHI